MNDLVVCPVCHRREGIPGSVVHGHSTEVSPFTIRSYQCMTCRHEWTTTKSLRIVDGVRIIDMEDASVSDSR